MFVICDGSTNVEIYKKIAVSGRRWQAAGGAAATGAANGYMHGAIVTRALTSAEADSSRSSRWAVAADHPLAFIHVVTANDNFIVCSFAGASLAAIRQRVQIDNLCNTKNFIAT